MPQTVKLFEQKVADRLDYDFDFFTVLRPGNNGEDEIKSVQVTVAPAASLTTADMVFTETVVKVFCSGGTANTTYTVSVSIESNEGRRKTLEMKLKVS
ncbi:MAG: hypothetical protein V1799_07730 [bacterium]